MIAAAIIAIALIVAAVMFISMSNALIELRNQVERSWANIDVILEQRHEEIPKLIAICEQFAKYERGTFDKLIEARQSYASAKKISDKIEQANQVSDQLKNIFALGEAYPQLQSSAQFVQLQSRISSLESQIADRKEMVNETVTNFNSRCQQLPTSIFAGMLGYKSMPLYKVADVNKSAPSLKMSLP